MAIGEVWAAVGPLVGSLAGVVTGGVLTGRQHRREEADREARAQRERLRIKVEQLYEDLDAARLTLTEQLAAVVNLQSPGGAQAGRSLVPADLTPLFRARDDFYAVTRRGHLYFSKAIHAAISETQTVALATSLAEHRAGQPFSREADDPLRIQVVTAIDELTHLHDALRGDLIGPEHEEKRPRILGRPSA